MDRRDAGTRPPRILALLVVSATVIASCAIAGPPEGTSPPAPDLSSPWQATPFSLPPAIVNAALAACETPDLGVDTPSSRLVLADVRGGGWITFLFAGPRYDSGHCIMRATSAGAFALVEGGRSTGDQWAGLSIASDGIQIRAIGPVEDDTANAPAGNSTLAVYGRVGDRVGGVDLVLAGGSRVRATTANGWFLAWWPSGLELTGTQTLDAAGQPLGDVVAAT
jgi:hypothetical protein